MKRAEKEVKSQEEIFNIIRECKVCRLGLCLEDVPYVVPLSFGFDGEYVYFHTAREGKKTDILQRNNQVCLEFECGVDLITHPEKPCSFSFSFRSVILQGVAEELTDDGEKRAALLQIMQHYSSQAWQAKDVPPAAVRVFRVRPEEITGKQSQNYF